MASVATIFFYPGEPGSWHFLQLLLEALLCFVITSGSTLDLLSPPVRSGTVNSTRSIGVLILDEWKKTFFLGVASDNTLLLGFRPVICKGKTDSV